MNVIILGPQGSGKGTQAEKLAQKFDLEHIDMGKFLREVAKRDTPLGKEIYDIQNVTKTLVPARILEEVFTIKLNDIERERGIAFDGFPRNIDQTEYFEKTMKEFGRQVDKVFYIKLSEKESLERISKRRVCTQCKKVFIFGRDIKNNDEKCDQCGGEIIQRIDDSEEGVKKRLEVFAQETMPVIEYYQKQEKLIEIDGDQDIEKVFEDIICELDKKVCHSERA
jgi:adenylate kinase